MCGIVGYIGHKPTATVILEGLERLEYRSYDSAGIAVEVPELLSPILKIVRLQLLAYHVPVLRGCDVDQPRNLAKSGTVE